MQHAQTTNLGTNMVFEKKKYKRKFPQDVRNLGTDMVFKKKKFKKASDLGLFL